MKRKYIGMVTHWNRKVREDYTKKGELNCVNSRGKEATELERLSIQKRRSMTNGML